MAKTLHFFRFIMYVGMYCEGFRVTIWNGDSRTYVAVTEPFLYQLHLHSVCKEQAGTTVPQVVVTHVSESVVCP